MGPSSRPGAVSLSTRRASEKRAGLPGTGCSKPRLRNLRRRAMQIQERTVGAVTILDLKGKLMLGDGDTLLKDKVRSLVSRGCRQLVLNLADVPHVDSVGIGEIV